jgi:hypothetical protein
MDCKWQEKKMKEIQEKGRKVKCSRGGFLENCMGNF